MARFWTGLVDETLNKHFILSRSSAFRSSRRLSCSFTLLTTLFVLTDIFPLEQHRRNQHNFLSPNLRQDSQQTKKLLCFRRVRGDHASYVHHVADTPLQDIKTTLLIDSSERVAMNTVTDTSPANPPKGFGYI